LCCLDDNMTNTYFVDMSELIDRFDYKYTDIEQNNDTQINKKKFLCNEIFWKYVYSFLSISYFATLSIVEWKILDDNSDYASNDPYFVWLQLLLMSIMNTFIFIIMPYLLFEIDQYDKNMANDCKCCSYSYDLCGNALMVSCIAIRFGQSVGMIISFGILYDTMHNTYDSRSFVDIFYLETINSIIFVMFTMLCGWILLYRLETK
jgi:hypothetical protein